MAKRGGFAIDNLLAESGAPDSMGAEVREGLSASPKQLPSKYFYDERGSELFERITELPEYYLTRAERALLERRAGEIARLTGFRELIELGSGSAKKTRLLIEAGLEEGTLRRYMPVEVSLEQAQLTAAEVARRYPEIEVHVVVADFEQHLTEVPGGETRLVALLGSTIGNFPEDEAVELLRHTSVLLGEKDWFLLGTDLVKDPRVLHAAYDDSQGVTAEFNNNILNVINRNLGGNFDAAQFEHVCRYNEEEARIELYLRPVRDQRVRLDEIDLEIAIAKGELIRTEVSCKYTRDSVDWLLARSGLELKHWFVDPSNAFALSLSRLI